MYKEILLSICEIGLGHGKCGSEGDVDNRCVYVSLCVYMYIERQRIELYVKHECKHTFVCSWF